MSVRKRASKTSAANDVEVYAEGIRLMKERSGTDEMDPIGWTYQSRIHGNPEARPREPGEPEDWSQCQHGSWWFLPWHRMYLLQFERIIRSLTGEAEWALPYWDYPDAGHAEIPPAFLDEGSPLFDETRKPRFPGDIASASWQATGSFEAFGGGRRTTPAHRGEQPGQVELNPHNPVHGLVGGDMAGFQSPLDPLFWIHHCNIDRLWEIWLTLDPPRLNPPDRSWLMTSFEFPDPDTGRRTLRVDSVTSAAAAGYSYDDLTPPSGEIERLAILRGMEPRRRRDADLELLGATTGPGSVAERTTIRLERRAVDRRLSRAADMRGEERGAALPLFLRLENVGMETGDASSMWNVYVEAEGSQDRHLVGTIAPFGLAGLTVNGGRQTMTFDVSDYRDELLESPSIDISCEPVHEEVEGRPFWERAGLYTSAE